MPLRATYRLQFHRDFGFAAAAEIVPYLGDLGISHVYASPILLARAGSTHGYDIVDHNRLNPELGSAADFEAFGAQLRQYGLGLILDFVPNHMGVGADNPFWRDVLEWGEQSDYAGWFDIDWQPDTPGLAGKVLVAVLGEQYGAALANGHLTLGYDPARGGFDVTAYDSHVLPVHPALYGEVLGRRHRVLERLGDAFAHLAAFRPHEKERARDLKERLRGEVEGSDAVRRALDEALARFRGTPGDQASWARLDRLIAQQRWRIAFFRVAADDINYRRFFNVNELAGLRMEQPAVFDHAHGFVFRLIADGVLDGLRIDHIDGLYDPKAYCLRVRAKAPRPITLHVEKILGPHEALREDWLADGTTGYETTNLLTGLLVDPKGEAALTQFYRRFTGDRRPFARIAREAKLTCIDNEFASELSALASSAARIAQSNPLSADFTRHGLRRALREIIASFRVYRTYIDEEGATTADREEILRAVAEARVANGDIDASVYDFLASLLTTDIVDEPGSGYSRQEVVVFAMRFQQVTGPVMAKGVEDTAFYRYMRFIAANEVGGEPGRLGVAASAFHEANRRRQKDAPLTLLTTSTHDTKRGEDLRARLAVLASTPPAYVAAIERWNERLSQAFADRETTPDPADLLLLFQTLIGLWPHDGEGGDADTLRERVRAAMEKSVREAKLNTGWAAPNATYEAALMEAVDALFADGGFTTDLSAFVADIAPAGAANSLTQAVLKLTIPGVPDIYQGAESWDFSLVDPDNRRPVDFVRRREALKRATASRDRALTAEDVLSGFAKTAAVQRLLGLRRDRPALFAAPYEALATEDDSLVAFMRGERTERLIVVAHRFPGGAAPQGTVALPEGRYHDVLRRRDIAAPAGGLKVGELLTALPVAVLVAGAGGTT